jgi:hypothetical protein
MNTYENSVTYAIETFSANMLACAHEYDAETEIADNLESIDFVIRNADNFDSVRELANAALASTLDTVVRELIFNTLLDYEE